MITRVARPLLLIAPIASLLMLMLFASVILLQSQLVTAAPRANFLVTKTDDSDDGTCDSDCSLREAVSAANDSPGLDTITLPPGMYTLSLTGSDDLNAFGDLDSHGPLTILGSGADTTMIDANLTDRALHAITGTLTISGVTLSRGNAGGQSGGAILAQAGLVLTSTMILSNQASFDGGGIAVYGALTISNTLVQDNRSELNRGGGAFISGTLALNNSQFVSNTAQTGGGGMFLFATTATLAGPSVAQVKPAATTEIDIALERGMFSGNQVLFGDGGGMAIEGADASEIHASFEVTESIFISNRAESGCGGGLLSSALNLNVGASSFSNNVAQSGGAVCVKPVGNLVSAAVILLENSFSKNTTYMSTGAVTVEGVAVTIERNKFCANVPNQLAVYGQGTIVNNFFLGGSALAPQLILDALLARDIALIHNSVHNLAGIDLPFDVTFMLARGEGDVHVGNNIIDYFNIGLQQDGPGKVDEDYNLFSTATLTLTSGVVDSGGNSFVGNAGFVDPASCDLHVTASSDAIDRAFRQFASVDYDIDWNMRPQDGDGNGSAEPDIGAHEFAAGQLQPPRGLFLPYVEGRFVP